MKPPDEKGAEPGSNRAKETNDPRILPHSGDAVNQVNEDAFENQTDKEGSRVTEKQSNREPEQQRDRETER
jgi:hypothetical protein